MSDFGLSAAQVCDVAYTLMMDGCRPPEPFESIDDWLDSPTAAELAEYAEVNAALGVG